MFDSSTKLVSTGGMFHDLDDHCTNGFIFNIGRGSIMNAELWAIMKACNLLGERVLNSWKLKVIIWQLSS